MFWVQLDSYLLSSGGNRKRLSIISKIFFGNTGLTVGNLLCVFPDVSALKGPINSKQRAAGGYGLGVSGCAAGGSVGVVY